MCFILPILSIHVSPQRECAGVREVAATASTFLTVAFSRDLYFFRGGLEGRISMRLANAVEGNL